MCYGFDGERALEQSLADRGTGRRSLLRGAAAGALGAGAVAAGVAAAPAAAAHGRDPGRGRQQQSMVPPDKISIQLYTVRAALRGDPGFDQSLRAIAGMGYPQVEQAGYYGRTAAELRAFYDELGIKCTSSHDGISDSEEALQTKLENARTLGQDFIVVPYLRSDSADDWKRWAERMNHEARRARSYGLRYGYHNHAHEWTIDLGGGKTPWDVLTSELDPRYVHLEIDLYWTATAGFETGESDLDRFSIDVIRSAPQRVLQYHVKDRHGHDGDMADLGTGMLDFERVFRAHRVRQYIVENDTPDITPLATAAIGYNYLRLGGGRGRR